MSTQLHEGMESILRYIQSEEPLVDEVIKEFSEIYGRTNAKQFVRALKDLHYIKLEERLIFAVAFGDDDVLSRSHEIYTLTPIGKNYLAKSIGGVTSYSNITNSNIANLSPNTTQSIKISQQPQDIQDKIEELQRAILKKDTGAIKNTFGYIADKSVDIAIALITGTVLR